MGPVPESEQEVRAVRDFIMKRLAREKPRPNLAAFYTIHTYGPEWLTPWGWTKQDPPKYKQLVNIPNAAKALGKPTKQHIFDLDHSIMTIVGRCEGRRRCYGITTRNEVQNLEISLSP
jgi:hypothetical protein